MGLKKTLSSSLGRKYVMALTGAGLFLFVIVHMIGNLQIYLGPKTLNNYAAALKGMPGLLWLVRIGLLTIFVIHIYVALRLTGQNNAARPISYVQKTRIKASAASQYMLISGLVILAFVIYHLLHFTVGITNPEQFNVRDPLGRHDVYRMSVLGFQKIGVSAFYIVCQLLLGWHLLHGAPSMFQSVGLNHPYWWPKVNAVCRFLVCVVVIGNISIPVSVLTGVISLPPTPGVS